MLDIPVTFSSTDRDAVAALESARDVANVLDSKGYRTTVVSLAEITQSAVQSAYMVFTADSLPSPPWLTPLPSKTRTSFKSFLDCLQIPYAGSAPKVMELAKDKLSAKRRLASLGVPTPPFHLISAIDDGELEYPLVLKPRRGSASIGIAMVESRADVIALIRNREDSPDDWYLEAFIDGRELTVGIVQLAQRIVAPLEILIGGGMLTTSCKLERPYPALKVPENSGRVVAVSDCAFAALDCAGYARVDIRLSRDGTPFVLELNTAPRLAINDYLAIAVKRAGISYDGMIEAILESGMAHARQERKLVGDDSACDTTANVLSLEP